MSTSTYTPPARQNRRKRQRRVPLVPILLAAVFLLGVLVGYQLPRSEAEEDGPDLAALFHRDPPEMPEWVTVDLLPVNKYSRPGIELKEVTGIVVHYVGNPGTTAQNNRNYFADLAENGTAYASAHFVIGLDGEVIQCVPLDEIAYCSNSRNDDTISIECCHPDEGGAFNQATYDALVELTGFLADYYDLDAEDVIRHYDVTGKECPKYYVDNEDAWLRFKDEVFG